MELRIVGKKPSVTRRRVKLFAAELANLSQAELSQIADDGSRPAWQRTLAVAVNTAATTGNFRLVDEAIGSILRVTGTEPKKALEKHGPSLEHHLAQDAGQTMDLGIVRSNLAKGALVAASLVGEQANRGRTRLNRLREALEAAEEEILDPERLKTLPMDMKLKISSVLSANAASEARYLLGLPATISTTIAALGHVETLQAASQTHKEDPRYDAAVQQVRTLIQQSIREKLTAQGKFKAGS